MYTASKQSMVEELVVFGKTKIFLYKRYLLITTLLEYLKAGADGYCGVMANFHPELYVWLCEHYKEADAQIVSNVLTMNSLIERQLYPVNENGI